MKHALVTGSTKGIGLAIVKKLIEKGCFVYMNHATDDAAAKVLNLPEEKHLIVKADLSTPTGAEQLTAAILNDKTSLDYIVFNAGATCKKPFGQIEYEDWNHVMNTNVNIPFFLCQKLSPIIKKNGSVLFTGSDMGIYPHAISSVYSVSKAATHMLARSLVKEMAPRGIRVNAIAPGFIDTDWQKSKPETLRASIEEKIALKRFGTPEEVADACLFALENSYMNGAVLQIDGGYDFE